MRKWEEIKDVDCHVCVLVRVHVRVFMCVYICWCLFVCLCVCYFFQYLAVHHVFVLQSTALVERSTTRQAGLVVCVHGVPTGPNMSTYRVFIVLRTEQQRRQGPSPENNVTSVRLTFWHTIICSTYWNKNIVILHLTDSYQIYQANKYLLIVYMRLLSVYHNLLHLFHN